VLFLLKNRRLKIIHHVVITDDAIKQLKLVLLCKSAN